MSLSSMLFQRCNLYSCTSTVDADGTTSETWELTYEHVKCYSEHSTNYFDITNGRIGAVARHILFIPKKYLVTTNMKVVIAEDPNSYLITHTDLKRRHHLECEMSVIESPQEAGGDVT